MQNAAAQARKTAILDAVLRVLARVGPGGVTHRAVSSEAQLPLDAAIYYYDSIDDLIGDALRLNIARQAQALRDVGDADMREFALLIHEWAHMHREVALAQYELLLMALRHNRSEPVAELWFTALGDVLDPDNTNPRRRRVGSYAIDGLLLRIIWSGAPSTVDGIEATLRDILDD